jgi:tyrosyl-tRNA synthetase
MDKIDDILTRGVANIIPNKQKLENLLRTGKKLNVYFGVDPTATKIHIGNAVQLRKLQAFAELGHNVVFLIGDFTALIGDTSDKDTERPSLTYEQIQENFKTYKSQAAKILDFSKITVKQNSEWLSKLNLADVVKLCQHFSVGDFISRELIRKRLDSGSRVGLHEVLYPVMQGYDSYYLDTDLQLGGTDQTFNMQAGRTLQKLLRNKESFVLSGEFLQGTDGRKMSKSWGNAIWLEDKPSDMYGKVMSVKDELIINYFKLATDLSFDEIGDIEKRFKNGENPMNLKKELAKRIVAELHGEKEAEDAQKHFSQVFQQKKIAESNMPKIKIPYQKLQLIELLLETHLVDSKTTAKRLLTSRAIEVNEKLVVNPKTEIDISGDGAIVKVGKKKFAKISQL